MSYDPERIYVFDDAGELLEDATVEVAAGEAASYPTTELRIHADAIGRIEVQLPEPELDRDRIEAARAMLEDIVDASDDQLGRIGVLQAELEELAEEM